MCLAMPQYEGWEVREAKMHQWGPQQATYFKASEGKLPIHFNMHIKKCDSEE